MNPPIPGANPSKYTSPVHVQPRQNIMIIMQREIHTTKNT